MTEKQTADELIWKFVKGNTDDVQIDWAYGKICALIAIDEIIKSNPTSPLKSSYISLYSEMVDEATEFWQKVKNELNKL